MDCRSLARGLATFGDTPRLPLQVVRTLDLEDNGFAGVFPFWLVQALATAPMAVVVELDVRCRIDHFLGSIAVY